MIAFTYAASGVLARHGFVSERRIERETTRRAWSATFFFASAAASAASLT